MFTILPYGSDNHFSSDKKLAGWIEQAAAVMEEKFAPKASASVEHEFETPMAPKAIGAKAAFIKGKDLVEPFLLGDQNQAGVSEVHWMISVLVHELRNLAQTVEGKDVNDGGARFLPPIRPNARLRIVRSGEDSRPRSTPHRW